MCQGLAVGGEANRCCETNEDALGLKMAGRSQSALPCAKHVTDEQRSGVQYLFLGTRV